MSHPSDTGQAYFHDNAMHKTDIVKKMAKMKDVNFMLFTTLPRMHLRLPA